MLTIVEEADGAVMAAEGEGRDAKEEHSALEDAVDAIVAYMCKLGACGGTALWVCMACQAVSSAHLVAVMWESVWGG